jgi:hypothetical protein
MALLASFLNKPNSNIWQLQIIVKITVMIIAVENKKFLEVQAHAEELTVCINPSDLNSFWLTVLYSLRVS